jgi:hypothetical protein
MINANRVDLIQVKARLTMGQAGLAGVVLEELPNEKGNDVGRILYFGIPDDGFRVERSHESCAEPR